MNASLNYNILAVDDEKGVLILVKKILEKSGFDVFAATNAVDAENILKKEMVDVVLLDVNMPGMNGFQLLEKIKSNKKYENIPVVMLTCQGELSDFEKGKELGVMDYITKPFSSKILIQRVNRAIVYATRSDEYQQGTGKEMLE